MQRVPARPRPGLLSTSALPAVLLAAALLVFVVWVRKIGDFGVETDFYGTYVPGARRIVRGDLEPWRYGVTGPLYECLLAVGMLLRIPPFAFAKILSAASMVGTLLVWRQIAFRTLRSRAAEFVPWLLLLSPAFVRFGYIASSDAFYCFLVSLGLFFLTRAETVEASVRAGIVALIAFLTRYQALVFPGFGVLWWAGKPKWVRLWTVFLAVFPGTVLVGLLVLPLLGVRLPKPEFLYNIHYEVSETRLDWDAYGEHLKERGSPTEILLRQPGLVFLTACSNVPGHLKNEALHVAGPCLALLVVLGALALIVARSGRGVPLRFASLWLLQFTSLLPAQASERYALTQVPLLAIVSAWGVDTLLRSTRARSIRGWVALLGGIFVCGLVLNVRDQVVYQDRQPRRLLETAAQVSGVIRPTDQIMARKPHLPYLLGATWVYFPDASDLTDLRMRMTETPANYVYYGKNEFALRPNFRYLWFPPYRPAGWDLVHSDPDGVLYRVSPEFFSFKIAEDDSTLRQLENDTLSGDELPLEQARRLAAYLGRTGRCAQCLSEYERIRKFAPLSPDEEQQVEACRAALQRTGATDTRP
jgi:hypothetical protein